MDSLRKMLKSFKKTIGLSSNKLLKCVLLNAAMDLFSCMNEPSYIDTQEQSYYWDMEQFDNMYSTLYPLPQPSKVFDTSTTYGIPDLDHELDLPQTSEGDAELEQPNVYSETLPHFEASTTLVYMSPIAAEQFYFLMPIYFDMCNTLAINAETENDIILYTAVKTNQATDLLEHADWGECETCTLHYEDGMDQSILWDSYDLHASRRDMSYVFADELHNFLSERYNSEDMMFMDPKPPENGNKKKILSSTPSLKKVKSRTLAL